MTGVGHISVGREQRINNTKSELTFLYNVPDQAHPGHTGGSCSVGYARSAVLSEMLTLKTLSKLLYKKIPTATSTHNFKRVEITYLEQYESTHIMPT